MGGGGGGGKRSKFGPLADQYLDGDISVCCKTVINIHTLKISISYELPGTTLTTGCTLALSETGSGVSIEVVVRRGVGSYFKKRDD